MPYFFFNFDKGLQVQDTQVQSTDRQFSRMLDEVLIAMVCTDCSKQVKRPKTGHEKLMTRRGQVGWTWCEPSVSLPTVAGFKSIKSRKKAADIVWSARVYQIEIKSCDWCTMKNSGDSSYDDEVYPVFNQGPQECQKIR